MENGPKSQQRALFNIYGVKSFFLKKKIWGLIHDVEEDGRICGCKTTTKRYDSLIEQ